VFRFLLKWLSSRHKPENLTSSIGDGKLWKPVNWTRLLFGLVVFRTLFLQPSSRCSKSSRSRVQLPSEIGQFVAPSTRRFAIGKLTGFESLYFRNLFSLAIETASKLTFIKHNLILEHPDLFKTGHRQEAETPEDEVANNIVADDVIIEDC